MSVVIPVYNTQEFVGECLDSVLQQSLAAIEVLCVDDGSSDGSRGVLARYARADSRVHVFERGEGGRGPGAARNLALQKARGDFVAFVDSDDRIEPHMLERMVDVAERDRSELVACMIQPFDEATGLFVGGCSYDRLIPLDWDGGPFQPKGLGSDIFRLRFASCNKIYSRSFLQRNAIKFAEDRFYEDLVFTFRCLIECSRMSFVREPFYHNRKSREGATTYSQGGRVFDAVGEMQSLEQYFEAEADRHELVPAFRAFEFRKLLSYLPKNDPEHMEPFYRALKAVAQAPELATSVYLSDSDQIVRQQIISADVFEFLVWYVWWLQVREQKVSRRLAKARKQRAAFRDQVRSLREEHQNRVHDLRTQNQALKDRVNKSARMRSRIKKSLTRLLRGVLPASAWERLRALRNRQARPEPRERSR